MGINGEVSVLKENNEKEKTEKDKKKDSIKMAERHARCITDCNHSKTKQ